MVKQVKPVRKTRAQKVLDGEMQNARRKTDSWADSYGLNQIKLTTAQQELSNKIQSNTLTFVDSVAGTGKSMTVLHTFVREYLNDSTKQMLIIRTPVEAGLDKIGALPDDYKAKVEPHFASTRKLLEQLLSRGKVETDMDHRIKFLIPNFVLGATFDNSLVMIDEAQQLQPVILKLLLERIGLNSRVVVVGDSNQLYTGSDGKRNALKDALPRFFDKEFNPKYPDVVFHKFNVDDVMRSDIVKTIIRAYQ